MSRFRSLFNRARIQDRSLYPVCVACFPRPQKHYWYVKDQYRAFLWFAPVGQHESLKTTCLIDKTTLPADIPNTPGFEGPNRSPPSAVPPEKPVKETGDTQLGEAGVLPPFDPQDKDAKKRSRVAQWEEKPLRQHPDKHRDPETPLVRLTDGSLAVQLMDRLRGCTVAPEIKPDGTIRYNMLKMVNAQRLNVPMVSQIVMAHREGMTAVLRQLASTFESLRHDTVDVADCCSEALTRSLLIVLDELHKADAKLVVEIEHIVSSQLLGVDVITSDGAHHDTLGGDFPYFRLLRTKADVEFEGCLEVVQKVFIEERTTHRVLFGSKNSMTAHHRMKFGSTISPILPGIPKTRDELKLWAQEVQAMDLKEIWTAAWNPFKVSPWILLNVDEFVSGTNQAAKN